MPHINITENPSIPWETIFDTINEGMILIRPDGTIFRANQSLEHLLGYARNELAGNSCLLLNCDECETMRSDENNSWCRLFHARKPIKTRCLIMKKDGSYLPVIKHASLVYGADGQPLFAVETFTDISRMEQLHEKLDLLTQHFHGDDGFYGIIGESQAMLDVFDVIRRAATSEAPVLIIGESGTGKELAAKAVHDLSGRREGPFVQVNCAALNQSLLESELFGHTKGAFTGAYRHRMGRFEYAQGGDLFLDEVGDIPRGVQVKLLRVLESKEIERVGDHRPVSIDTRVISATNKDLETLIKRNRFREDLFFRINTIPIYLPRLRQRREDIPLLVDHFIRRNKEITDKPIQGVSAVAMDRFMAYDWPGNVRELKSAIEYAFVVRDSGLIEPGDLPKPVMESRPAVFSAPANNRDSSKECDELIQALKQSLGNKSEAARILGVSRGTVWNRMRKYGIDMKKILYS
ncbi:Response regulator of zinc sigma-54-dependent two-component system [Olavius algarvensis associated proteobacterium Delta 3]|nr:Response regulator of zinc sigma-54-dependent two-component system [Olavius algarvensis associated proteobacterium Delta 3]CAB5136745.1 Response regulator of zinc sigma-54-dependent two-component system [Olavius algarvensis associated proteobacterium Delta 3]